eukprot:Opistho-2@431
MGTSGDGHPHTHGHSHTDTHSHADWKDSQNEESGASSSGVVHAPVYDSLHLAAQLDRARFVFETLDHNNDGRVTRSELRQALVHLGLPNECIIEKIMGSKASAEEGSISIAEFNSYVAERESELRKAFDRVDTNNKGTLEFAEVWEVLKSLNVQVTEPQVRLLMDKIDSNKDGVVDFNEWSRFLMLHPSCELSDIFSYWRRAAALDIGALKLLFLILFSDVCEVSALCCVVLASPDKHSHHTHSYTQTH